MVEENNQNTQKNSTYKEIYASILISLIAVVLLRTFVIGLAVVDGPSMENTIQSGDRIFYAKLVKPDRGDIVVVETKDNLKIIKRVIGLEGDTIEIKKGDLYVNNKLKKENYIKEPMYDTDFKKIAVPKGQIFVMGDNRNISADSRKFGTFSLKTQYEGKVVLEIWNNFKFY